MMFCLLVVMWPDNGQLDYLVFLASWSTSGRSLSLSSCSFLSFLAFAFSCSVFLVFEEEVEEVEKEVFLASLILFTCEQKILLQNVQFQFNPPGT